MDTDYPHSPHLVPLLTLHPTPRKPLKANTHMDATPGLVLNKLRRVSPFEATNILHPGTGHNFRPLLCTRWHSASGSTSSQPGWPRPPESPQDQFCLASPPGVCSSWILSLETPLPWVSVSNFRLWNSSRYWDRRLGERESSKKGKGTNIYPHYHK